MATFNPAEHLMKLKGKDYLQVQWRLVWFREAHPLWSIDTRLERLENDHAVFTAKICDENGLQKSSGYGSESIKDFGDYIEKAETKAVGRALAMLGFGTQFTGGELDEGERIVDSPVDRRPRRAKDMDGVPDGFPEDKLICARCRNKVTAYVDANGKTVSAMKVADAANRRFGLTLCAECAQKQQAEDAKDAALARLEDAFAESV